MEIVHNLNRTLRNLFKFRYLVWYPLNRTHTVFLIILGGWGLNLTRSHKWKPMIVLSTFVFIFSSFLYTALLVCRANISWTFIIKFVDSMKKQTTSLHSYLYSSFHGWNSLQFDKSRSTGNHLNGNYFMCWKWHSKLLMDMHSPEWSWIWANVSLVSVNLEYVRSCPSKVTDERFDSQ